VTASYSGVDIVDITDPTNPTLGANSSAPGYAIGLAIYGDRLFVADYVSGVKVLDVSDPTSPVLEDSHDATGYWYGVALSGDLAHAVGSGGLTVLHIADAVLPPIGDGNCSLSDYGMAIAVAGDFAYVACRTAGLRVIDISDPSLPAGVGGYVTRLPRTLRSPATVPMLQIVSLVFLSSISVILPVPIRRVGPIVGVPGILPM
jgi:hypothetical protein